MQRFGQVIKVKKEKLDEYIALHSNVWKGVNDALKKSNIQNYSIYHYKDFLFAYFEYVGEDFAKDMEKIAQDPITKEWWKCTDPCQVSLSKTQQWLDIQEVFHLD
ncbi:L-rhamnose mutarotase [Helicobacter anseris]|uniref:L-rhamnose mutarotase n=1 Tax=Helicobacter anseris TaxID=375926 RepID=UPI001FE66BA4|nr:L-rhamnose mutarotase [Helicobacter anseris]